ncbi:hypothetical protein [Streptomyces sp. NPDC048603]|uniref:hypothetical protein n=1 Tax=Streptomyces sp. NPDC048603 TaxID=3365577 RepID=UPI00371AB68A
MTEPNIPGGSAEAELRNLFHGAVSSLEPSEDALDRLRYAVPRRRARKRRALIGAAVAVVLAGAAGIPAALQLTSGQGASQGTKTVAGHGQGTDGETDGGDPNLAKPGGGKGKASKSPGKGKGSPEPGKPDPKDTQDPHPRDNGTSGTAPGGGDPSTGKPSGKGKTVPLPPASAPAAPQCSPNQLGAVADTQTPDADGKVYGSFRVTNVSSQGCVVTGVGVVTAVGAGSGGSGSVPVVRHTENDPASGLTPPSSSAESLMLPPNTAYEVQFAWVPNEDPCPGGTPDSTRTAGTGTDGGAEGATGTDTLNGQTGEGLSVSHTAQPGAPETRTTIPSACGTGTVYRTGVIPVA